ncbi:SDR family NAD(P)-dependent oxidoreductase [Nocardiopsis suaedae]|uniref:SDR family oxidoreductase n=1 Tax=Nocardiopsis suaedae TaxID=3018444 RepID=A0ABT4TNJ5_9ACTN|nr:SDR family oxidoreductase [Nocardiopsis suaedae]MDA2806257.1 SDR family oxidoreductase [Nocardiopsis suaedae]
MDNAQNTETNHLPLLGGAALVTGGSRGIGAATAVRLAGLGADVAITYREREESAAQVVDRVKAAGRRSLAIRADAADLGAVTGAVRRTADAFGRLDILVNNAAAFLMAATEETSDEDLDRMVAANVEAPFAAAREALRHMGEGGRIINVGSNVSERLPFPVLTLYSTTKSAMVGLTKGLAREGGPRGITSAMVVPGPTDTETSPADGPMAEAISGFTALGRYVRPEEVAETVAFLAGPGGSATTGTAVYVDAGFTA